MPIRKPDKVLLHHIPLKFVRSKVAGGGRKALDSSIPLVPFIDFLVVLVVFLLSSFSASGELIAQRAGLTMPSATNVVELELAPIIQIDSRVITFDGRRVADTQTLLQNPENERIEPLIRDLETVRTNWNALHPREPFAGTVIVQADLAIDFRVIKKVMNAAAAAGYPNISFAVNQAGGS